jgi:hypothetical protein
VERLGHTREQIPIDESLIEEMAREFFNGQYPYVKVVPRLEATDKTSFARGATLFAKVKEKYIAHLTRGTERENRKSLLSRWTHGLSSMGCLTSRHSADTLSQSRSIAAVGQSRVTLIILMMPVC